MSLFLKHFYDFILWTLLYDFYRKIEQGYYTKIRKHETKVKCKKVFTILIKLCNKF